MSLFVNGYNVEIVLNLLPSPSLSRKTKIKRKALTNYYKRTNFS